MAETKLSLKLLVDRKANKVLFAEAGKDVVDFLFNLFSLPVGAVTRLITTGAMVGSLGNLYESIEHLNQEYMQENGSKELLLKPSNQVTNLRFLLPNTNPPERRFYACLHTNHGYDYTNHGYVTETVNTPCPHCKQAMQKEFKFVSNTNATANTTGGVGFVKGLVTYMVTDDLSVSPMSMISGISLLHKFNVKDFGVLEEKVVEFGFKEAVELLKASLQSKAVLTTVFLVKQELEVVDISSELP